MMQKIMHLPVHSKLQMNLEYLFALASTNNSLKASDNKYEMVTWLSTSS